MDLQINVENIDNQVGKNNIHLKGLIEVVEGDSLKACFEELFTGCAGSDCLMEMKIEKAYWINLSKNKPEAARDIWIQFAN